MSSLQIQSKASTISDNTHWEKLNDLINEYAIYLTASVITLQIHLKAVLCEATEKFKQCREIYTRDAFVQAARASFCESLINAQDLAPPRQVATCIIIYYRYKNFLQLIKFVSDCKPKCKDREFWIFYLAKKNTRMPPGSIQFDELPHLYQRESKSGEPELAQWNIKIRKIRQDAGRELNNFENLLAEELAGILDSGEMKNLEELAALAKEIVPSSSASDKVTLSELDATLSLNVDGQTKLQKDNHVSNSSPESLTNDQQESSSQTSQPIPDVGLPTTGQSLQSSEVQDTVISSPKSEIEVIRQAIDYIDQRETEIRNSHSNSSVKGQRLDEKLVEELTNLRQKKAMLEAGSKTFKAVVKGHGEGIVIVNGKNKYGKKKDAVYILVPYLSSGMPSEIVKIGKMSFSVRYCWLHLNYKRPIQTKFIS